MYNTVVTIGGALALGGTVWFVASTLNEPAPRPAIETAEDAGDLDVPDPQAVPLDDPAPAPIEGTRGGSDEQAESPLPPTSEPPRPGLRGVRWVATDPVLFEDETAGSDAEPPSHPPRSPSLAADARRSRLYRERSLKRPPPAPMLAEEAAAQADGDDQCPEPENRTAALGE